MQRKTTLVCGNEAELVNKFVNLLGSTSHMKFIYRYKPSRLPIGYKFRTLQVGNQGFESWVEEIPRQNHSSLCDGKMLTLLDQFLHHNKILMN